MLTREILVANAALAGLTDEQIAAITTLSANDENSVIAKKTGEEAVELVIAAKNGDKEEIVGECADLFYHTLVLLANAGVKLSDVCAELEERHS